jgi:hypothetical protein
VLQRALLQPLPLGEPADLAVLLDDGAGDATLAEFDGKRHADRAAADDHHLVSLACASSSLAYAGSSLAHVGSSSRGRDRAVVSRRNLGGGA